MSPTTPLLEGVPQSMISKEWYRCLQGAYDASNFAENQSPLGTIDGVNDTFTLTQTPAPGSVCLYLNGLRLRPTVDYTVSGNQIIFKPGSIPQINDNIYADFRV